MRDDNVRRLATGLASQNLAVLDLSGCHLVAEPVPVESWAAGLAPSLTSLNLSGAVLSPCAHFQPLGCDLLPLSLLPPPILLPRQTCGRADIVLSPTSLVHTALDGACQTAVPSFAPQTCPCQSACIPLPHSHRFPPSLAPLPAMTHAPAGCWQVIDISRLKVCTLLRELDASGCWQVGDAPLAQVLAQLAPCLR